MDAWVADYSGSLMRGIDFSMAGRDGFAREKAVGYLFLVILASVMSHGFLGNEQCSI